VKHRTLFFAVAISAAFLVSACGDDGEAASKPTAETLPATTAATSPTTSATPLALPGAAHTDEVLSLLRKALTGTHLNATDSGDRTEPCRISLFRIYPATKAYPHTRETITTMLHAAGWKNALTNGSDESHLTTDTWDVFVTRQTAATDDKGKQYETLEIGASCLPLPTAP
jgi:hypothetical protein